MIPSLNDQALTRASWPALGNEGECPAWTCDCCTHHVPKEMGFYMPRMVEVSGIRYFACSESCARALFIIHHQYALREMPAEGRFVHLAYDYGEPSKHRPVLLDLDTVSKMAIVENHFGSFPRERCEDPDDEWVELHWWVSDPQKNFGYMLVRRQAKKIIDLWRTRPARSLMAAPKLEPVAVGPDR